MCVINHYITFIFGGKLHQFRQVYNIAFHREYTINNNQFYTFRFASLQLRLESFHIVVGKLKYLREREPAAFYDRCMIKLIKKKIVLTARKYRNNTKVNLEASTVA